MNDIDLELHETYSYEQVNEISSLLLTADERLYDKHAEQPHGDEILRYHGLGVLVNAADEIRHDAKVSDVTFHLDGHPDVANALTFVATDIPDYIREEVNSRHSRLQLRHVDPDRDDPLATFVITVESASGMEE